MEKWSIIRREVKSYEGGIVMRGILSRLREMCRGLSRRDRLCLAGLSVLIVSLLLIPPIYSGGGYFVSPVERDGVTFVTLDVGQSNAALMFSENAVFMVDTGSNAAEDTVVAALGYYGVRTIDGIFLTHEDEDHAGGLDRILEDATVKRLILTGACYRILMKGAMRAAIENSIRQKGTEIVFAECGKTLTYDTITAEVLFPVETAEGNDGSMVLRIVYGETAAIFLGDLEEEGENALYLRMLSLGKDIRADMLMVAHHGAATSSGGALLAMISPRYAVISCGLDNAYGHPSATVLDRLSFVGADVLRTDLLGTVVIRSDGKRMAYEK